MKKLVFATCALALLSACAPAVPDSAAGVGFDDYDAVAAQRAARDAQLESGSSVVPPAPAVASAPIGTASTASVEATAEAALAAANSGDGVVHASPSNPAPTAVSNPGGISAENDFTRVSSQRSIEGDAERIAQNRAAYQVVEPTALPTREGGDGPNIVTYALKTSNPVGTRVYNRIGFNAQNRFVRNCAKYASPDRAQQSFLKNGGPSRDRLGLDPDGDGYACQWDPRPFRKAAAGQG